MTALTILLSVAAVLLLLGLLPLGLRWTFGQSGSGLWICVGPLRVRLRTDGAKKTEKQDKKKEKKEEKKEKKSKPKKKKKKELHPDLWETLDLLETLLDSLSAGGVRLCRHLRIDPLELTVVFDGARDPVGAAACFGAAQTAMWSLMPRAEELFRIPNPSLHLRMDFDAVDMSAKGKIGLSLRVCDLLAAGFTVLLPLLRWRSGFRKAHANDPVEESEPVEDDKTADKIA